MAPHVRKIQEQHKNDLVVLGIAMDGPETVANVQPLAHRNGMTFPIGIDEDTHVAGLYNPRKSDPYFVVIDASGRIVRKREGFIVSDEQALDQDITASITSAPQSGGTAKN